MRPTTFHWFFGSAHFVLALTMWVASAYLGTEYIYWALGAAACSAGHGVRAFLLEGKEVRR